MVEAEEEEEEEMKEEAKVRRKWTCQSRPAKNASNIQLNEPAFCCNRTFCCGIEMEMEGQHFLGVPPKHL